MLWAIAVRNTSRPVVFITGRLSLTEAGLCVEFTKFGGAS
jgi:hypothetical protein